MDTAARSSAAPARPESRRGLWIALGLVLLIRLPFLNQAIQGDDHTYIAEAAHAQVDPLHPLRLRIVFAGEEIDLRGHPHPPLNAWTLGALIAGTWNYKEGFKRYRRATS